MQAFLDWCRSDVGISTLTSLGTFLLALICYAIRSLAKKVTNDKLRRLIELLPDALESAENNGGSAQQKLTFATDYLTNRIKGLPIETITDAIENGITISKTVNVGDKSTNVDKNKNSTSSGSTRIV